MKRSKKGFTLVEMLVVVAIIGLLMGVMAGGFSVVQTLAWQSRSQELVSNVATALSIYIQKEGSWPTAILESQGLVNNKVCAVLQHAKLLDVTTATQIEFNSDGDMMVTLNPNSPERFGLFSPWGQRLIKKDPLKAATPGTVPEEFKKHVLQFRVDINLDGKIDADDSSLGVIPGDGVTIRSSAIVWSCGPLGKSDTKWGAQRTQDNRQSWSVGK